jgi:hypothetical protein
VSLPGLSALPRGAGFGDCGVGAGGRVTALEEAVIYILRKMEMETNNRFESSVLLDLRIAVQQEIERRKSNDTEHDRDR